MQGKVRSCVVAIIIVLPRTSCHVRINPLGTDRPPLGPTREAHQPPRKVATIGMLGGFGALSGRHPPTTHANTCHRGASVPRLTQSEGAPSLILYRYIYLCGLHATKNHFSLEFLALFFPGYPLLSISSSSTFQSQEVLATFVHPTCSLK